MLIDHRYLIQELLSGNGAARVYRVQDTLTGHLRVLKCVEGSPASPETRQLRREFLHLSRIRHPRIVQVHDLGQSVRRHQPESPHEGQNPPGQEAEHKTEESVTMPASDGTRPHNQLLYFTQDFVRGQKLSALRGASPSLCLTHFFELTEAAAVVHQHELRCGDLKPDNAIVGPNGVCLIDFGLSREAHSLEIEGFPKGTLPYMAPEQLAGKAADTRSDVFSLGVILFELLSGAPPFPTADTPSSRLTALTSAPSRASELLPEELRTKLPKVMLSFIDHLLALHPTGRPHDASALLQGLETLSKHPEVDFTCASPHPFIPEHTLLGREEELNFLAKHYAGAQSSRGGVIRITGSPGIGKTRIMSELAYRLLDASDGRLLRLSAGQLSPEHEPFLRAWLTDPLDLPDSAPSSWHAFERARRRALEGDGPIPAILLDEIELTPPSSGNSASSASGGPTRSLRPGLWICQIPPAGESPEQDASSAEKEKSTSRSGDILHVAGLSEADVQNIVELASGLVRAPQTIARFHHFSEGNPGVLRATLLHPEGMSQPSPVLMGLLEPLARNELSQLPPETLQVARHAALLGENIETDVLASLLNGPSAELNSHLDTLVRQGLLARNPDCQTRFHFRRPMVRALLAGQLPSERRKEVHLSAGQVLERRLQLGVTVSNASLADHFDRADDDERARRYLGRALREAARADAHLEANELCQRLLARLPEGEPERTKLFSQLGDINLSLQRFPQADQSFERALELLASQAIRDPLIDKLKADVLAKQAYAREQRGNFAGARERLEEALSLSRALAGADDHQLITLEHGNLALSLARVRFREGRLDDARDGLLPALELFDSENHTSGLIEGLVLEGLIRLDSGDPDAAEAPLTRALALSTSTGDKKGRMKALHDLHILEARRGKLPEAIDYLQKALSLAESEGDVARLGAGYHNLGNLQRRLGESRKALKSYARASSTFERVGNQAGLVTVHYSRAELLRERREYRRALEELDTAETMAESIGGGFYLQALRRTRLVRGELMLAVGELEKAQALLQESLRVARSVGDRNAAKVAELALAELCLARGETAEVERRCAELAQQAREDDLAGAPHRALCQLHYHLAQHHGRNYIERSRARGSEALGTALLEKCQAQLADEGIVGIRDKLEQAASLLENAGQGQLTIQARQLLLEMDFSDTERQTLLNGVLELLKHLGDRRKVLANLVSLAAHVLRAERGLLLYCEKEGKVVDFSVLHGMNLGEAQRASGEIIRRIARTGGPVVIPDAMDDPSLIGSASIQDLQIRSVLGFLVSRDENGMWILYLDHRQLPGVFTTESKPILERLTQLAGGLLREIRWRESIVARVEARGSRGRLFGMIGRSVEIHKVREYIENLGHLKLNNENLLFIGESGTGKELVARAVHQVVQGDKKIPFIAQSCADIPAELMESTLFGHRRGAFTGAREDRPGIFELGNGGVLFLDEIGELPLGLQASLLRVLEERTVSRVGEPERSRTLSLIVVCATNRDLRKEVVDGRFRRDLFHRLNQVFRLPPLRERREDILPLLRHFMSLFEDFAGQGPEDLFSAEVLMWFHEHPWPGNVRELKNIVEAIPVRIKARRHEQVQLQDLGLRTHERTASSEEERSESTSDTMTTLREFTDRMETAYIRKVMERSAWDITTAANTLGLTYQGLRKRLIRYDWMKEVERKRRG